MILSVRERSALIALMACNRAVPNAELESSYKLGLDKVQREHLNREGLIVSQKSGQRFSHELTDKGWAWVRRELSAPMPPRSGSSGGALYALLHAIGVLLNARDHQLADLFQPPRIHDHPAPGPTVEDSIRAAYRSLRRRQRDWVSLADLRSRIEGATRAQIDTALLAMLDAQDIMLTLNEDRKSLTEEDKKAAIRVAGTDMHFISME